MAGHVVAMGGGGFLAGDPSSPLDDLLLALAARQRPRTAFLERGAVLGGVSAGANCWFEACVTDSFSVELDGLEDGIGLLPGSFCPHFDAEERRRPVYARLVADGFPPGIACDDGAAAIYHGTELIEVVADRPGAGGYKMSAAGEEPITTRLLR